MKKRILNISTLVAVFAFASTSVHAQQGFGTNQPSKAAAIEMKSDSKGLLIPRVTLTELTNFGPIQGGTTVTVAHANSLLVYNTATATNLTPGYYYWTATSTVPTADGTVGTWKRLMANDDITALTLNGDVTGSLTANTVAKIQGRDVLNTAPTNNQVLTWNGTAWAPATITPAQIGNKAALTTQDGIAITAGSGTDALLAAATIGITNGGIAPVKIEPAAEPRTTRMVMVTQTDGTVTWIPQTDIAPTTTNVLSLTGNALKSTVNGVESSVNLTDANITSDKRITSNSIDLTGATGSTLTDVTMEIKPGNANEVLITNATGDGVSWVNQSVIVPTTTNELSSSVNTMTSNVNGISDDATIINSNALSLNTDNELVSTVNGVASTALDLGPAVTAATTHTIAVSGNTLTSTVNGVAPTASILNGFSNTLLGTTLTTNANGLTAPIDLAPAIKAGETPTSLNQNTTSGVITYTPEQGADQTANVVNGTTDNLISFNQGAYLDAAAVQGAQKTSVVDTDTPDYAMVTPNTPQGSNETTYTVSVKATPRFFYMPAVVFNTDNQTNPNSPITRDLYQLYADQFGGAAHNIVQGVNSSGVAVESVLYNKGVISSTGAASLVVFGRGELEYHITYYDTAVFDNVSINENGVLSYEIIGEATPMSYMNIVFVIK